jgi:hypothetical protein
MESFWTKIGSDAGVAREFSLQADSPVSKVCTPNNKNSNNGFEERNGYMFR